MDRGQSGSQTDAAFEVGTALVRPRSGTIPSKLVQELIGEAMRELTQAIAPGPLLQRALHSLTPAEASVEFTMTMKQEGPALRLRRTTPLRVRVRWHEVGPG